MKESVDDLVDGLWSYQLGDAIKGKDFVKDADGCLFEHQMRCMCSLTRHPADALHSNNKTLPYDFILIFKGRQQLLQSP